MALCVLLLMLAFWDLVLRSRDGDCYRNRNVIVIWMCALIGAMCVYIKWRDNIKGKQMSVKVWELKPATGHHRCAVKVKLESAILSIRTEGGGCTRMARGGIRLVHGLTKSTLITYFSGMKRDPKYAFLHAFFLIYLSCLFQNLSIWPKTQILQP